MRRIVLLLVLVTAAGAIGAAQAPSAGVQLVQRAMDAIGGRDRVMAIRSLQVIGYGQMAYFNGGSNITGHPDAPQKWQNINEYTQTIDAANRRMRVQQRLIYDFVFANAPGQLGLTRTNEVLDADVAYNIGQNGPQRANAAAARARRMLMLEHPVMVLRAALDPSSRLSAVRTQGPHRVIEVTVKEGDVITLGIDQTSGLPAFVSYVIPHNNLGDVTLRTAYSGWVPERGVLLPLGYNTTMDWRNVVYRKIYVDRNVIDGPIDEMTAPEAVRAAAAPQGFGGGNAAALQAVKMADHVWYLNGNTIFEFDDHLTMFETNRGDAALQNVLKVVNSLVPGKRLTQVIASHHHFDHSAGVRAATAEGLTIIARRGNEGIFREMTSRPAKLFPDALGRKPTPLKFIPVDDHLKLKDNTNEVDIYHVIANNHMADAVMAHVPAASLLVEGDMTTQNWDYQWWGNSYLDNIEHRKIKVTTNLAVHAQKPLPIAEVVAAIERQVRGAQELCRKATEAQLYQPGCPVQYPRSLPAALTAR